MFVRTTAHRDSKFRYTKVGSKIPGSKLYNRKKFYPRGATRGSLLSFLAMPLPHCRVPHLSTFLYLLEENNFLRSLVISLLANKRFGEFRDLLSKAVAA